MKSIFVYNPESGKGKIKQYKDYIIEKLSQKYGEIECVETEYAGHAHDLAKDAVGKYDYFFVSGGDGTINEVVNGFGGAENKPILGYIPSGTVNDVANSLGLSKNIKKCVKILVEGNVFEHDIFKVNNRYGIYVCCAGLFTKTSYDTSRRSKKLFGKFAYFAKVLKDINTEKPTHVKLEVDGETIEKDCAMILIFNSKSTAGFKINRKAKLNDGVVELLLFHSHKKSIWLAEILRTARFFFFGVNSVKNSKKVTYRQTSSFKMKLEDGTTINLDGEKSGHGSFNFSVIHKGLSIIVPRKTNRRNKNETTT